ncbi:MAG: class I tRNA ligase family protein [Candidatus Peregrinibacteria bacterium]
MKKYYVTTAIPYVNAAPHVGFAMEVVQADFLARYHRLKGDETYFVTGVDEHGVKLYETAKKAGKDTKAFADENAEKFEALKGKLNLSNDDFIRTTSDRHKAGVRKFWKKLVEAGDIYKGSYKGNYCSGCEAFVSDKDLDEEGNCPVHKRQPEQLEEENYFFKLSKYSDKVKELIEKDEYLILPLSRKHEMLNIIGEEGLRDVSFSRPKNVLPWGIDVPDDDSQVIYVWGDALTNYITAIDYENEGDLFGKFWPCDAHIIGKDILRFHAGIWPAMLLSACVELPKALYVHGFITGEGQKMSKSIGNVIDPLEYVEKYGIDALRYYLMREIPTTDDGDFSQSRFEELYNSELANGVGNMVNRVVIMTEKYAGGKAPAKTDGKGVKDEVLKLVADYERAIGDFDLKKACEAVVGLVDFGNKYIDDKKPWEMMKEVDSDGAKEVPEVLYNLLEVLRYLVILLLPIMPETAAKIAVQIGLKADGLSFDEEWGQIKEGAEIKKEDSLFPRLED